MEKEISGKQSVSDPYTATSQSQSQSQHGHISIASSPGRSNHSSGELKQPATTHDAHISLASSPARSDHSSGELKPPTLQQRLEEDYPSRSSISSDRTSLSHGSFPSPIDPEKELRASPPENPPGKFPDKHHEPVEMVRSRSPPPEDPPVDKQPTPVTVVNQFVRSEPPALSKKMDPGRGSGKVEKGGGSFGSGRRSRSSLYILRKTEREQMVKKAALGFRVFGFMFCLVSFSVMAADRNQGWALDSFNRYKEFRYCMSVNVIGFAYSIAQAFDMVHQLATGKPIVLLRLRYYFDFAIDQMVTYLLISASSSAAIRIDDWKSNWGSDKFPDMASAAVSTSFLAFAALASSSLISGYALCTSKST